jgi:hypothetical protein
MKRFLVFGYDNWYPSGGWDDFRGEFDTLEEAKDFADKLATDHAHIIDIQGRMNYDRQHSRAYDAYKI